MKQWQKIVGVITLVAIGTSTAYSIFEIQGAYIGQDLICDENRILWEVQSYIIALVCLDISLYLIAIALFICLWRKGGKQ